MRLAQFAVPVCAAPLLASCLFLLDYEELEGTPLGAAGASSDPTAAPGGESSAGAGGAAPSCQDCNDDDPCTIDTCVALPGQEPECQHASTRGLKLDGFEAELRAEQHLRVALVGGGKSFYLSALEVNGGEPRVSLYRFSDDGAEMEPLLTDLPVSGRPVSNIGLATQELSGGEVALHGFVAVAEELNERSTRVVHLMSRKSEVTSSVVGRSYRTDDLRGFPQALAIGDQIVGAWIQEDGTIAAHRVGAGTSDYFGDASLPATTLSLLSTEEQRPAAFFTAQAGGERLGAWVEPLGGERAQLPECDMDPGTYLSSAVIPTQLGGIWLATVTRAGDDYLTSDGGTLVCRGVTCVGAPNDCDPSRPALAVRNPAGATVHFDTDDPGIIHSVVAVPRLAPKAEGNGFEAKLDLVLGWADYAATPVQSRDLGSVELARADADEDQGFAGPDWPTVAILPGLRAAVAWIAPAVEGSGTALHVERYKMCLGEP